MTIKDRHVIDYITKSDDKNRVTLIMLEDRPLDTDGIGQQTMDKVDDYLGIITSGQLYDQVPEARGSDVLVQYNVIDDPKSSVEIVRILEAAQRLYAEHGIDFHIVHLDMPD